MRDEDKDGLLNRRQFTSSTVMALLAGVTVTVVGCASDNPSAPSNPPPGSNTDVNGSVGANHGHTAVIRSADVQAGNAVTLDIRGTSDHPHSVNLSGAEVMQIAGGQRVSKTSSSDNSVAFGPHNHEVVFN